VLWHYVGEQWQPVDLGAAGLRRDVILRLAFRDRSDGWALAVAALDQVSQAQPHLLHFNGRSWMDATPDSLDHMSRLRDLCIPTSEQGWIAGIAPGVEAQRWRGVVLSRQAGTWHEETLPESSGRTWVLNRLACLPNGVVLATGAVFGLEPNGTPQDGLLLRYDGAWKRIALPDELRTYELGQIWAASERDVWLVASQDSGFSLLHFLDGQWLQTSPPTLPGGRLGSDGVSLDAIWFPSPDEGWAVANDFHGPGVTRGLVFHYQHGVWRKRNWNWHFWHERWFGLFGH